MRQACQNQDMRDAILDAVGRLLERYGYRKMTVEDIAHDAGIGKGTAYLYFPSKEEMALGWIDRANEWLLADLREIAGLTDPPAERVRLMLVKRVMYRFDGVQRFAQSLDELYSAMRPLFLARRNCYHDAEAQVFADVLSKGRSTGDFALGNDYATSRMLLMATNSLLPYSLSPAELGQRDEIESKTLAMADMLLTGLLHRRTE